MAIRYRKIQNSFTGGEVSPRLLARTDLDTYNNSASEMENFISLAHGGATRRPGTVLVGEVDDSNKNVRIIPFVYSVNESFVLVLNNGRIQFIKDGAYVLTGGSPDARVEVSIPYADDELSEITYAQFGSTMFFCHPNHKPKQLYRVTSTTWTIEDLDFTYDALADYTYENAAISFLIYTTGDGFDVGDKFEVTTDGSGNVTSTVPTITGTGDITNIDVNADLDDGVTWTMECTFSSPDRQIFSVVRNVAPTNWVAQWHDGDYPTAVSFYEQRLYFAGSPSHPQRIWGTTQGNYTDLTLGPRDDDAVQFTIASNTFDQIRKLKNTRQLLPLTYGSEYSMAGSQSSGITPSSVLIRSHTTHGVAEVEPLRVGDELLFVQRDGLKVRSIRYDVTLDANIAPDLTLAAEHITGDGVTDMTFAQAPDQIIWAVREDGVLLSCTHLREQNITAWARHTTDGTFKNVTSLPTGRSDDVYLAVERTINGATKTYIEQFDKTVYGDSCLKGSSGSPATATWTGLDHLEGEEVIVVADGKVHPNKIVSSGSITLDYEASEIHVGLAFIPKLVLLHPDLTASDGTSQGASLSIYEAVFRVQDTVGITINGEAIPVLNTNSTLDQAPEPYTGDLKKGLTGWSTPNNLEITQEIPMPITVLGVILKLTVGE